MIGKWPAHQPRRFTLSRGKLCPVGVPFGSVGTIAMSGSSNHIATRLIHRAPREAGCPRSLALGDRGMIGKWPAHQPRRFTLSLEKLCPVGVPFGSVGTIAMSGSSNHIATRLIHRAPREAGCPRALALGDRGMIGKWPAHQPRRFTLSLEKLCPVGVPFGSVGTIAMSGSSNHIATRLIRRAPREAGCPRSLALGDRGMIGKWPAHQPRRFTLSRGKLCPVGVPFGSVGTIAMSGSSNHIAARLIHRAPREAGCPRSLALGDRGMIGKWPAHQPRRITLSRGKLCPVGVPFGSVGTIAMSGSSNPIPTFPRAAKNQKT